MPHLDDVIDMAARQHRADMAKDDNTAVDAAVHSVSAYKSRIAAAIGTYYRTHDVDQDRQEYAKDQARQEKRAARQATGKRNEHEEQCDLCDWLDSRRVRYFAVPNGVVFGGMSRLAIAKYRAYLRAEGLKPGAPDLVIVDPAPGCRAPVCVEMKAIGGQVSDAQMAFLDEMKARGWKVILAYGRDDAVRKLEELGYE
jgi:hypothetical protein